MCMCACMHIFKCVCIYACGRLNMCVCVHVCTIHYTINAITQFSLLLSSHPVGNALNASLCNLLASFLDS